MELIRAFLFVLLMFRPPIYIASYVIRASGAQAYEIAVIRFASKDQASHGVECLKEYLTAREGRFFSILLLFGFFYL